ncbi:aldehyde dehydrogenase family protein [Oceanobacillus sp. Castelsardo]|uniref:aldehyde dehydrogenase family protein n=1 Tax=Oceanobacillus sp. Castelsardo TaxID=1851204 RepID=UPI000838A175|nr:aldehyde dehydrogenase family protein [Oceanobacillus sp. Castelsardo]
MENVLQTNKVEQFLQLNKSYIDGKWVNGQGNETVNILNPYNNETLTEVKIASKQQVEEAYKCAEDAHVEWGRNAALRKKVFQKAAQFFEDHKEEILHLLAIETGSAPFKAQLEYNITLGAFQAYSSIIDKVYEKWNPEQELMPGKVNEIHRLPLGVISSIAPFNFPLYLSLRGILPALALGNSVVHKADIQVGIVSGSLIAKAFEEAGIPAGVFSSVLTTPQEIGDIMLENQHVKLIAFTGSTQVGRHISTIAGKHFKRAALELGGNAPFVVLEDADVDQAVDAAIFGKFLHQGQICMITNRFIVHEKHYEEFTTKFVERAKNVPYGDPLNPNTVVGPLINQTQLQKAIKNVEKAKNAGVDVLLEGKVEGNIMTPYVFGNVDNSSELAQTELFAPIALVVNAASDEEAMAFASDTEFGLSSSLFTNDIEKGREYAIGLESGMTHINDQTVNDLPNAPFGGMRNSGVGRFGVPFVIDEFTQYKWISIQEEKREYPF